MIKRVMRVINEIQSIFDTIHKMESNIENMQTAIGRVEGRQTENLELGQCEYKVYSQWGEDGIIQYLIHSIEIPNKIFVEFGVQNYEESNTRFLLVNNNWKGLILDGSQEFIEYIKRDPIYWRYNLKAENLFITKDNINNILANNGIQGDIGLLSVDIDGNDYWVWDAINVIQPRIVICEYNSIFGPKLKVTTPYREDFVREKYHYSYLVYGASIRALNDLAISKGYRLVAGNKAGNNVFFVREDVLQESSLQECPVEEAYRESQFREGRDQDGGLTFASMAERRKQIEGVEVYNLETGETYPFSADVLGGGKIE